VQIVSTEMKGNRYEPITVQAGILVRWTVNADADELNGCNNPVTIPKYGIQKQLSPGENTIEFTPEEPGNVVYTCWMGMIRGTIRVVEDLGNVDSGDIPVEPAEAPFSGGGCCG